MSRRLKNRAAFSYSATISLVQVDERLWNMIYPVVRQFFWRVVDDYVFQFVSHGVVIAVIVGAVLCPRNSGSFFSQLPDFGRASFYDVLNLSFSDDLAFGSRGVENNFIDAGFTSAFSKFVFLLSIKNDFSVFWLNR